MPGMVQEDAAVFGALLILGDAAFDLVLDAPAGFGEGEDGGFVAFADQGIEGLLEAGLFHGDHFGELAPAGGQRLKRDLVGVGQRAEGVAHAISEARDEAGVQPVGLGAFAFGDAEGLDAARIDEADGKAGRRQGLDEGVGVGADRLQHHPFDALALEACEQGGEGLGPVGGPKDGAGRQADIEITLAGIDAGGRGKSHAIAPACGPAQAAQATVRSTPLSECARAGTTILAIRNPTSCTRSGQSNPGRPKMQEPINVASTNRAPPLRSILNR